MESSVTIDLSLKIVQQKEETVYNQEESVEPGTDMIIIMKWQVESVRDGYNKRFRQSQLQLTLSQKIVKQEIVTIEKSQVESVRDRYNKKVRQNQFQLT